MPFGESKSANNYSIFHYPFQCRKFSLANKRRELNFYGLVVNKFTRSRSKKKYVVCLPVFAPLTQSAANAVFVTGTYKDLTATDGLTQ